MWCYTGGSEKKIEKNGLLAATIAVAEHLHKFIWEVEQNMPYDELMMWVAWFEYKEEREKEVKNRSERMSRSKRGSKKGS